MLILSKRHANQNIRILHIFAYILYIRIRIPPLESCLQKTIQQSATSLTPPVLLMCTGTTMVSAELSDGVKTRDSSLEAGSVSASVM